MFGFLGAIFSRLGAISQASPATGAASTAGQPLGLLLILTKAS